MVSGTGQNFGLKGSRAPAVPTAIGSFPDAEDTIALKHWQNVMRGHAAANVIPVVASNRIGNERGRSCSLRFFGSSFICDHMGEMQAVADEETHGVLTADVDIDHANAYRLNWALFRDRRRKCTGSFSRWMACECLLPWRQASASPAGAKRYAPTDAAGRRLSRFKSSPGRKSAVRTAFKLHTFTRSAATCVRLSQDRPAVATLKRSMLRRPSQIHYYVVQGACLC